MITEQPSDLGLGEVLRDCNCSVPIRGVTSSPSHPTFPAIKLMGYYQSAVVVVSCVSEMGPPHYPHPLELHHDRGRQAAEGVYVSKLNKNMTCQFPGLLLRRGEPSRRSEALKARQNLHLDPYRTGFSVSENLYCGVFRLCFQVFLEGRKGQFTFSLPPVVSERLYLRGDELLRDADVDLGVTRPLESVAATDDASVCLENKVQDTKNCGGRDVGAKKCEGKDIGKKCKSSGVDAKKCEGKDIGIKCKSRGVDAKKCEGKDIGKKCKSRGVDAKKCEGRGCDAGDSLDMLYASQANEETSSQGKLKHSGEVNERDENLDNLPYEVNCNQTNSSKERELLSDVRGSRGISTTVDSNGSYGVPDSDTNAVDGSVEDAAPTSAGVAALPLASEYSSSTTNAEPRVDSQLNSLEHTNMSSSTKPSLVLRESGSLVVAADVSEENMSLNKFSNYSLTNGDKEYTVLPNVEKKTTASDGNTNVFLPISESASSGSYTQCTVSREDNDTSAAGISRCAQDEEETSCLDEKQGAEATKQRAWARFGDENGQHLTLRNKDNPKVLSFKVLKKSSGSHKDKVSSPVQSIKWLIRGCPLKCCGRKVCSHGSITQDGYVGAPTPKEVCAGVKEKMEGLTDDCQMLTDETRALEARAVTSEYITCEGSPEVSAVPSVVTLNPKLEAVNNNFEMFMPVKLCSNSRVDGNSDVLCESSQMDNFRAQISGASASPCSSGITASTSVPPSPTIPTSEESHLVNKVSEKLAGTQNQEITSQYSDFDYMLKFSTADDKDGNDTDDGVNAEVVHTSLDSSSKTSNLSCVAVGPRRSDTTTTRACAAEEKGSEVPTERETEHDKLKASDAERLSRTDAMSRDGQMTCLPSTREKPEKTLLDEKVLFQSKLISISEKPVASPLKNCNDLNLHVKTCLEKSNTILHEGRVVEKKNIQVQSHEHKKSPETMSESSAPLKSADLQLDNTELFLKSLDKTQSCASSSASLVRKINNSGCKLGGRSTAASIGVEKLRELMASPYDHGSSGEVCGMVASEDVTFGEVSSTVDIPVEVEPTGTPGTQPVERESSVQEDKSKDKKEMLLRANNVAPEVSRVTSLSLECVSPLGVDLERSSAEDVTRVDGSVTVMVNDRTATSPSDIESENNQNLCVNPKDSVDKIVPYYTEIESYKQLERSKKGILQVDSYGKHCEKKCSTNEIKDELRKECKTNRAIGKIDGACQKMDDLANRVGGLEEKKKHCEKEGSRLQNESPHRAFCESGNLSRSSIRTLLAVEDQKHCFSEGKREKERSLCTADSKKTLDEHNRDTEPQKDRHRNRRFTRSNSTDRKEESRRRRSSEKDHSRNIRFTRSRSTDRKKESQEKKSSEKDHSRNRRFTRSPSADRKTEKERRGRSFRNVNHESRGSGNTSVKSLSEYDDRVRSDMNRERSHDSKESKDSRFFHNLKNSKHSTVYLDSRRNRNWDFSLSSNHHSRDSSVSHGSKERDSSVNRGLKDRDSSVNSSKNRDSCSESRAGIRSHKRQQEKDTSRTSPGPTTISDGDYGSQNMSERKELESEIYCRSKEKIEIRGHYDSVSRYNVEALTLAKENPQELGEHCSDELGGFEEQKKLDYSSKKLSSKPVEKSERKINIENKSNEQNHENVDETEPRCRNEIDALGQQDQDKAKEIEGYRVRVSNISEDTSVDNITKNGRNVKSGEEITESDERIRDRSSSVESSREQANLERNNSSCCRDVKGYVRKLLHNGDTINRVSFSDEKQGSSIEGSVESKALHEVGNDCFVNNQEVCKNKDEVINLAAVEITAKTTLSIEHEQEDYKFKHHLPPHDDAVRTLYETGDVGKTVTKTSQKDQSKKRAHTEIIGSVETICGIKKRLKVSTPNGFKIVQEKGYDSNRDKKLEAKEDQKEQLTRPSKEMASQSMPVFSATEDTVQDSSQISCVELLPEKDMDSRKENSSCDQSPGSSDKEKESYYRQFVMNESFSSDTSLPCIDEFADVTPHRSIVNADVSTRPQSNEVSVVVEKLDLHLLGGLTTIDLSQKNIVLSPPKQGASTKKSPINTGCGRVFTGDHRRKLFTPLKKETAIESVSSLTRLGKNTSITISGVRFTSESHCSTPEAGDDGDLSLQLESSSHQQNLRTGLRSDVNSPITHRSPIPHTQSSSSSVCGKETTSCKVKTHDDVIAVSRAAVTASVGQQSCEKRLLSVTDGGNKDGGSAKKRKVDHEVNLVELVHKYWESTLSAAMKTAKQNLTLRKACEPPKSNLTILPRYPYASARSGSYRHPRLWHNIYSFISRTGNARYRMSEIYFASKRNQLQHRKRLPHLRNSPRPTKLHRKGKKLNKHRHKPQTSTLNYEIRKKYVQEEYNLRRGKSSRTVSDEVCSETSETIPGAKKYKASNMKYSSLTRSKEDGEENVADSIERVLLRVRRSLGTQSSEPSTSSDLSSVETEECNPLKIHSSKVTQNRKSCSSIENNENWKYDSNQNKSVGSSDVSFIEDTVDPQDLLSQNDLDCISVVLREADFIDTNSTSCDDTNDAGLPATLCTEEDSEVSVPSFESNGSTNIQRKTKSGVEENSCERNFSQFQAKRFTPPQTLLGSGCLDKTSNPNSEVGRNSVNQVSIMDENSTSVGVISSHLTSARTTNFAQLHEPSLNGDHSDILLLPSVRNQIAKNSPLEVMQNNLCASSLVATTGSLISDRKLAGSESTALLEKIYGACIGTKIIFHCGTLLPTFIFRNPDGVFIFHCTRCRYFTSSKNKIRTHECACNSLMTCSKCSFKTSSPTEMKIHPRMHELQKNKCFCSECDYVSENKGSIERHVMVHAYVRDGTLESFLEFYKTSRNAGPGIRCPFCDEFFKDMLEVRAHIRVHTNVRSYTCSYCDFIGFSLVALSRHSHIHEENMLKCPYCSFTSTDQQAIKQHFLTHL
ncbi:Rel domain (RHD) DNA-binding domain [Trinorchestia longiramus]|nr:Rel domain (RHD) DNA-binding domain [Trinorchestia longiramus]